MNKNSNPLDTLIDFASVLGADKFWVNNAKDELKKLRSKINSLTKKVDETNKFAVEESDLYLETARQLGTLQKSLNKPVAFALTNEHGDLYDLRLQNNPYNDQTKVVPLYRINNE
jgi:hypothetical protein